MAEGGRGYAIGTLARSKPDGQKTAQSFKNDRKPKWLHDDKELLYGSVLYRAKHLGMVDVKEPSGNEVVRTAFKQLKSFGQSSKQPDVDIAISVYSVVVTEVKSKMHVSKHRLQRISYCAEDKQLGEKAFAYIVRGKTENSYQCCCFETQSQSRKVTLTVGQAFHLSYEKYLEAKQSQERFVKLRKKLKTSKEKEDFAKKLTELHREPSMKELADLAATPAEDTSKRHKHIKERQELWKELTNNDDSDKSSQQMTEKEQPMTEIVKDWKKITKTLDPLAKDGAGHAHKLKSAADVDSQINIIEDQLEAMKDALELFDQIVLDFEGAPSSESHSRNTQNEGNGELTAL